MYEEAGGPPPQEEEDKEEEEEEEGAIRRLDELLPTRPLTVVDLVAPVPVAGWDTPNEHRMPQLLAPLKDWTHRSLGINPADTTRFEPVSEKGQYVVNMDPYGRDEAFCSRPRGNFPETFGNLSNGDISSLLYFAR